jgi:hypothetical protein
MRAVSRRGWIAFGLASAAVAYGALLFASVFFVPAYSGESCIVRVDQRSDCVSTTATLVGVNGVGVLVAVALPLLAALAGWLLLHRQCATRSRTAGNLAWLVVVALLLFSFVTGFSIGLFVLPIALLLGVSAALVDTA